jgi:hypothetical protein
MKKITQKILAFTILVNLFSGTVSAFAQENGSWSTTYPSYDTGSWSTTYPTYDTGSWSTTQPTYDTGSWSTTYPSYDTGSWSTTYPTYDTGTSYPTYDTGVTYSSVNYGSTNYSGYTAPSYSTGYSYPSTPSWTGYSYPTATYPTASYPTATYQAPAPTYTNGTVVNTTSCPSGTTLNGSVCQNIVTPPVVTTTNCPNGTVLVNNTCQNTVTPPVVTNTNCPSNTTYVNGYCQQIINPPTVIYQTCWNGSTIPANSVCPSQYKTCPNGTSVPISQICYGNENTYVAPPVIAFNNVVTNPVTSITTTSARCNGIGLIAQGAQSTGWFEYGQTANLGRVTASASIGSAQTAPFSNVLTNLQVNTTYYCRAVMQNQYGIVKGEIVKFTTKAKSVVYITPITTIKKTTTVKIVKKNEIICSDGSVIGVGNQSTATMINNGQKLVALQIDKVSGDLSPSSVVTYRLSYKNLSNSLLDGMTVQVTIPQEITLTGNSVGVYDPATRILTLTTNGIAPYAQGIITWTGIVNKDAPLGKSIVTTAYASYTVPSTHVQDEVTAYVVGSIAQATVSPADSSNHVIGLGDKTFLPDTLVEWLALIAILFIVFILARSIYTSYRDERHVNAH